jgi:hypothetical protein
MERGDRPCDCAPQSVSSGTPGYLSRQYGEERRRVPVAGRQPSETREGKGRGHHRGRRAGHVSQGVTRERGRATCLLVTLPDWGPGRAKALAWFGGFDQIPSPSGTPRTHRGRQGIGTRATSDASREGQGGSLCGAASRCRWGTTAHGTPWREGNAGHHVGRDSTTGETVRAPTVTPKLQRLAAQAARDPRRGFPTRAPRSDEDVLREAYRHTSQASAAGIDGVTATRDAAPRDDHRRALSERLRRGRSQAPPVERGWIEKEDGGQRPLGKPACEDQRVHRAGARRLEASSAQDVPDGSEGFRRGRRPQDARHERRERCMQEGIGWSLEAALRGSCDRINRTPRQAVLRQRVKDGRIRRLMGKWLRAGVREAGVLTHPKTGVVPGGVIAPR